MLTVFCFFVFEKQGLMFTTDGRPVGEKVAGGIATLYSMPYWSTVRPVMASAPLPPRLTLALPGHHNPWGPFRGIAGGCVVSWAAGGSPHILVGHGEVSFLVEGIPDSSHEQISYCFVVFWILERVGLLLGASEGAALWLPCTPLCCWLERPHLSFQWRFWAAVIRSSVLPTGLGASPS